MSKILLTGGGTAGHATPNIALMPVLQKDGHSILYIGTKDGIERELVEKTGVTYYPISAGKLRRYFSMKNLSDIFRILKGYGEAKRILRSETPDIVFSKGGFVTVPVVYAAKAAKIPVVIHESDFTPGLANRLCLPKAQRVCVSFEATTKHVSGDKCVHTGLPVREELLNGSREKGLKNLGFGADKPMLLIIGGSLGAQAINDAVDTCLSSLLELFHITHIRGKGKLNPSLEGREGYRQFEYVSEGLNDLMAAADIVLSRAGANVIFELLALKKPMLLVPLPMESSRGDQILNAEYFVKNNFAHALMQSDMNAASLPEELKKLAVSAENMKMSMEKSDIQNGTENVIRVIYTVLEENK